MLKKIIFSAFALMIFSAASEAYEITAKVDNQQVTAGEVFDLELIYDGQDIDDSQPDLSVLQHNFRIYSTSASMQSSFINGKGQTTRTWKIGLMPKTQGQLTIPSVKIGKLTSNPLDIDVLPQGSTISKSTNDNAENNDNLNTSAQLDKFSVNMEIDEKNPYLGQQINAVVTIIDNVGLQINSEPMWENSENWELQTLKSPTVDNDGKGGRVIKFYYALFAQKSGRQTLPQAHIDGYYIDFESSQPTFSNGIWGLLDAGFNSMFGTQKPIYLQTEPQEIEVRAVPQNYGPYKWLPAEKLALQARWSDEKPLFKVGETVSREIILTAQGAAQALLPEFDFAENPALKQYPEQPQLSSVVHNDKLIAQSITRIVYIPQKSGELEFPAIEVHWFDVDTNRAQTAVIPAQKVYVEKNGLAEDSFTAIQEAKAANSPSVETSADAQSAENLITDTVSTLKLIVAIFAAFAAGMALSFMLFIRKFNRGNKNYAENIVKSIAEDLKNGDMRALQSHLIAWGNAVYPTAEIHNINDVAKQVENDTFAEQMNILNNILYGQGKERIDGQIILQSLNEAGKKRKNKRKNEPLPQLYK